MKVNWIHWSERWI